MMVMRLACYLISRRIPRQIHRRQPALFHQRFDIALNRRNPEALDFARGMLQHFLRPKRTINRNKYIANCRLLPCVALQHRLCFQLRQQRLTHGCDNAPFANLSCVRDVPSVDTSPFAHASFQTPVQRHAHPLKNLKIRFFLPSAGALIHRHSGLSQIQIYFHGNNDSSLS